MKNPFSQKQNIEELEKKINDLIQQNTEMKAELEAIKQNGTATQASEAEPTPVHTKPVTYDDTVESPAPEAKPSEPEHQDNKPTAEDALPDATEPQPAAEPQPAVEPQPAAEVHPAVATQTPDSVVPKPANEIPVQPAQLPQEALALLKKVDAHLAETTYKDNLIKDIHEELQQYKNGLRQEIVKPVLKDIILLYDNTKDALDNNPETASADPAFVKLRKETQNLLYAIEDLLYAYDIEPVTVSVGDTFDPKTQKALKKEPAPSDDKDKTIAKMLKAGFKNTATGHMMRDITVVVFAK